MRAPFSALLVLLAIGETAAFRFGSPSFTRRRHSSPSHLFAKKGAPPQTAYSYVEGGDYENRKEEIEAMGGDPFFLSDDDEFVEKQQADEPLASSLEAPFGGPDPTLLVEERYATDGKGPTPKDPPPQKEILQEDWEWDGTIDEDAHMMDF